MSKRELSREKKAHVLRDLSRDLDAGRAARDGGLDPDGLRGILSEAAALFEPAKSSEPEVGMGRASLYVDGGARNNPGPSAAGVVILDEAGATMLEEGLYLGSGTNNEAEYRALILGLERAATMGCRELRVHSDSELMVKQLNGVYRVKQPHLMDLFSRVKGLLGSFGTVEFVHVRREENRRADALVNQALDGYIKRGRPKQAG